MTSKSRGQCDNIKVFNQGKSNQGKIRDLIAKKCVVTLISLKFVKRNGTRVPNSSAALGFGFKLVNSGERFRAILALLFSFR